MWIPSGHFTFGAMVLIAYAAITLVSAGFRPTGRGRGRMLSPEERGQVEAVLLEAYCQRAVDDRQFLKQFLDGYLGDATAAKQHAWDQAAIDPAFLPQLVADDLAKNSDRQLLTLLEQYAPTAHGEIDFNPSFRLARHGDVRRMFRSLNTTQYAMFGVGAAVLFAMLLYPPWIRQVDEITRIFFVQDSRKVLSERFAGYHYVFRNDLPPDWQKKEMTGNLGQTKTTRDRHLIARRYLLPQLVVATAVAAFAIWLATGRNASSPSRQPPQAA